MKKIEKRTAGVTIADIKERVVFRWNAKHENA